MKHDFPDPEPLLGSLIVAGVRMFLVGRTGLGKTLFGFAIAVAMASGSPILHWKAGRPVRVLYIDGEMPGALIQQRLCDALRRPRGPKLDGRLIIFARDMEDEFAKRFPCLGPFRPLNTEVGHNWLLALIDAIGGVDVVILDNVMSLLEGIQKEEETWTGANPLVDSLSRRRIAQIWLDHTGHSTNRQYGTSTKSWRFDTLGMMTALPPEQLLKGEVGFALSFEPPDGKCRRRTPDNWVDFEPCIIRLKDDHWTSEPIGGKAKDVAKVAPSRKPFYDALTSAITKSTDGPGRTTLDTWRDECLRRGLIEKATDGETYKIRDARYRDFRKAKSELIAANWIAIDGDVVLDLHGKWS